MSNSIIAKWLRIHPYVTGDHMGSPLQENAHFRNRFKRTSHGTIRRSFPTIRIRNIPTNPNLSVCLIALRRRRRLVALQQTAIPPRTATDSEGVHPLAFMADERNRTRAQNHATHRTYIAKMPVGAPRPKGEEQSPSPTI